MRPSFVRFSPALTAIGKRFGFDAHYFAKNSAVVTTAYGISALKGLITGYLVTRLFPTQMYGEYKFVLSIIGVVGFIGLPGLPSALASAIARKEPVSLTRIARWFCLVSGMGSLVILGCIALLPSWGRSDLWPLFLIAALLFVPSSLSTNLYSGIIRGTGAFTTAFRVSFLSNILVTVTVFIMLMIKPSSLLLLTFTMAIPAIVYIAGLIPFERKMRSKNSQKKILLTAGQLSMATIPSSISWYLDGLIISAFFGLNQLAIFSVAMLIPEQVKTWTKELFPILFSKQASGKDTNERRRKMDKGVLIGTAIFAIGIAIYIAIAPFIIPLLFPNYPAAQLVQLTSVAALTLLVAPASVYPQFLEARRMVKAVHWCNWTASAVFVTALFTLIPLYGPMGAVISRGLFRLTNAVTAYISVRRTPVDPQ